MATSQRRWSRELPPDLSDLMNKLIKHAASFIQVFNNRGARMRRIVGELQKIADNVKKMQETTDTDRTAGAVIGGLGLGIGLLASAVFTGGASLLVAAGAAPGGAFVVGTNVRKLKIENKSAKEVEELGKEFMEIVEPLKNNLEEIKTTCEELEQRAAGGQAKQSLSEMEEFQWILRRVSELRERSGEVLLVAVAVLEMINDILKLIVRVFSVTATPKEDQKLIESIRQSADQCQKVVNEFDQMKRELRAFT